MVKIDFQGFEHHVLDGLQNHIADVCIIELDMGLQQLYVGHYTLYNTLPRLEAAGFEVVSIDSGFVDQKTGQVLDRDLLARRVIPLG